MQSHRKVGIRNGGGNGMGWTPIGRWNRKWKQTEWKWKKAEWKWKGGMRSWVQKSRTGSWEEVQIGAPRVWGGSRWVSDCWSKGSGQCLHGATAARALEWRPEVGKDQEVG